MILAETCPSCSCLITWFVGLLLKITLKGLLVDWKCLWSMFVIWFLNITRKSRNFHAFTQAYLAHAQTNFPAAVQNTNIWISAPPPPPNYRACYGPVKQAVRTQLDNTFVNRLARYEFRFWWPLTSNICAHSCSNTFLLTTIDTTHLKRFVFTNTLLRQVYTSPETTETFNLLHKITDEKQFRNVLYTKSNMVNMEKNVVNMETMANI